ncbi:MAG: hypothetical protein IKP31_00705 [Lachnospiraceae bacterium]|nr:hypothetical protein [Lachnospiraceae bacterium]
MRLSGQTIRLIMKGSEICGLALVIGLLICMVHANPFAETMSVVFGVLFVLSIIVIQLQRYQNNFEERGY